MNFAALSAAFSQPLESEGLDVRKVPTAGTILSMRVYPSVQAQVAIAIFEAAPPESLNLVLGNGFEFQEFEWSGRVCARVCADRPRLPARRRTRDP